MLRGLLILDLVKPTKISSIELELSAKASTAWPEGVGARRVEVSETHKVFSATTVYFRASAEGARRGVSVGPGINLNDDDHERDLEWRRGRNAARTRSPSPIREREGDIDLRPISSRASSDSSTSLPSPSTPITRIARGQSVDAANFTRTPHSHHQDEFAPPYTPPYTPKTTRSGDLMLSPQQSGSLGQLPQIHEDPARPAEDPARTLEDMRAALMAELGTEAGVPRSTSAINSSSSALNTPNSGVPTASSGSSTRSFRERSRSRQLASSEHVESTSSVSHSRSRVIASPPISPTDRSPSREERGRHGRRRSSRFSLSTMSTALFDAVRSHSRSTRRPSPPPDAGSVTRGRAMERGAYEREESGSAIRSKERSRLGLVSGLLGLDKPMSVREDSSPGPAASVEWKEYRPGTYTYPISFTIPGDAPPTLRCDYGSVVWRLKANVHRPGTFTSKLSDTREVTMIHCPMEEDTEDTENIIVERQWDQQLQYLITISGRSFYIGGTIPVSITLMPLMKIKVYRLAVFLEEKVEYYHQRRLSRTDPISRVLLLSIKHDGEKPHPLIPLESDDPDTFLESPMRELADPDVDVSEFASNLMGPGPWSFHKDVPMPKSCSVLRFTNKNKMSNIHITHTLKVLVRVERGDDLHMDPKTGKRKLFDIVVQSPVQVLSCRCNPEWTALPRYSETFQGAQEDSAPDGCPCEEHELHHGPKLVLERVASKLSSDSASSLVSAVDSQPINLAVMPSLRTRQIDALMERNVRFERLVSGMETESGDAPPAYGETD
ncbi:hypothetical protein BD626DRAFT_391817 [Schizophyllum amplum]|uniref:Arrestin C-terminal-like domain-containing protein n=1 Tax=Schizophyllum amplum TaxID=97359 RepID=A0A550CW98_9AGAR|nr:hypothetical protein BD626DRAFT_391817 [Auriculariopsis ampla]